jgi:DNA-binding transcriptional regulator of glucitol operon
VATSFRFVWRPNWLIGHLLVLAAAVTMVLLGRWQLDVSNRKHFDLQNFGYALQWWAFSIFALAFWAKILRDRSRAVSSVPPAAPEPPLEAPVTYRRYVMPARRFDDADPEHARYNAYLAALAEQDSRER